MGIFGVHETALQLKSMRAEILANNLINSSTPGFQARDFDFHQAMKAEMNSALAGQGQQTQHQESQSSITQPELAYRKPMQSSASGNTVETDVEQMMYAQNALEYKATISFIRQRASTIVQALRGGE